MYQECRHVMPNGFKCRANALRDKPYCYFHARLHNLRPTNSASKETASETASLDQPIQFPVLEDRCAIQLALAQVLDALSHSRIDPVLARLYLMGLQIASRNVDRDVWILPIDAVESLTRTRDGEELAPVTIVCEPGDNCSQCAGFRSCNEPQARKTRAQQQLTANS